jgi:hypothetical protein
LPKLLGRAVSAEKKSVIAQLLVWKASLGILGSPMEVYSMLNWPKKPPSTPENQPSGLEIHIRVSEAFADKVMASFKQEVMRWIPWVVATLLGLAGLPTLAERIIEASLLEPPPESVNSEEGH